MEELYSDIKEELRQEIQFLFTILPQLELKTAIDLLELYRKHLSEYEQNYLDFALQIWWEKRKNEESISN